LKSWEWSGSTGSRLATASLARLPNDWQHDFSNELS